jgi:hypothetical protein
VSVPLRGEHWTKICGELHAGQPTCKKERLGSATRSGESMNLDMYYLPMTADLGEHGKSVFRAFFCTMGPQTVERQLEHQ